MESKHLAASQAAADGTLLVILDFDRTLTSNFMPDGQRVTSAHGILEVASVLSEAFKSRAQELFRKYYPIEIDETMPIETKVPIMHEWYGQVHELILKEYVTKDNIASAEFLRQALPFPLQESTHVVSNRMVFDETGRLVNFSEPLLHMFNKTAAFFPEVWKLFGWDPATPEHVQEERSGALYTSLLAWPSAVIFGLLAVWKFRLSKQLGSEVLRKDALCSVLGALLALICALAAVLEEVVDGNPKAVAGPKLRGCDEKVTKRYNMRRTSPHNGFT
eukprot:g28154.t1